MRNLVLEGFVHFGVPERKGMKKLVIPKIEEEWKSKKELTFVLHTRRLDPILLNVRTPDVTGTVSKNWRHYGRDVPKFVGPRAETIFPYRMH